MIFLHRANLKRLRTGTENRFVSGSADRLRSQPDDVAAQDFPRLVTLACHDLRTPLATVNGFAKTLLRGGELDERTLRFVG